MYIVCSICNKKFFQKKLSQKYCSPKCSKEKRKYVKREAQERYRKRNWEKIKEKNNINYKKKVEKNPNWNKKRFQNFKKNNPESYKRRYTRGHELIRNDPIKRKKRNKTLKIWMRNKRKNDNWFKIRGALSVRLNQFLRSKKTRKKSSISQLIGCSKEFLIKHLESQFYNHPVTNEKMSWDNYGKYIVGGKVVWEVDHIKPYNAFKDTDLKKIQTQKIINHFSNLRPLWSTENRSKGGNYSTNAS